MSEQNPFGLNILDRNVDWAAAYGYLDAAHPAMTLVYNNVTQAQAIKANHPSMHVVHRQYNANDHQWHTVTGPLEWFTAHRAHGAGGVIVQCYNEPLASDLRVIDFMLEIWQHARGTQTHVAGPHYSVGNPNEKRIEAGDYDRLIREVCTNPYAWLGLHEYTKGNPETEYPYYIGRHKFWYERAAVLGLKLTRVLITEHGLDMGGGPEDGWRNRGISGQQYADMLIRARSLSPYRPPVAIFGFGDGFGWEGFNCDDADFLSAVKSYREPVEEPPVTYTWIEGRCESVPGTFVNVRSARAIASSNVVGKMYPGMAVQYSTQTADDNGYRWTPLNWNGVTRWVAVLNLTTGAPVAVLSANPLPKPLEWSLPVGLTAWSITSGFGVPRDYDGDGVMDDQHEGIDFAPAQLIESSMFVRAMADGIVEKARWLDEWLSDRAAGRPSNYGCYVRIKSQDGAQVYTHWYAHLSTPMVENGTLVKRGQTIGVVGDTGNSRGTKWGGLHLHITIQAAGKGSSMGGLPNVIDPAVLLSELA